VMVTVKEAIEETATALPITTSCFLPTKSAKSPEGLHDRAGQPARPAPD